MAFDFSEIKAKVAEKIAEEIDEQLPEGVVEKAAGIVLRTFGEVLIEVSKSEKLGG